MILVVSMLVWCCKTMVSPVEWKTTRLAWALAYICFPLAAEARQAPAAESSGKPYFVAAGNGNDAWSGRLAAPNAAHTDGPFQTLSKAQAALRTSPTKRVSVRAGTYYLGAGLAFIWSDAGEEWTSYAGEIAVLDGGGSGVLKFTGTSNVSVTGFELRRMGEGTMVFNGAKAVTIRGNRFTDCRLECMSGSALTNAIIDNNTFRGQAPGNPPGNTTTAYSAIRLGYGSSNNQITHNLIEDCQGGGIAFAAGPKDPPNSDNTIDRNLIRNVDTNVFDMGAIYIYDASHNGVGNRVTNNVIAGNGGADYQKNQTKGIYLDVGTSNVVVSGNVCRACGHFAWQIHAGDHNLITNNIFDLSSPGTLLGLYQTDPHWKGFGMVKNEMTQNIVYFGGTVPPALYQVNIDASNAPPVAKNNLYYASKGAAIPNTGAVVDAHPVYANPGLQWLGASNYALASTARGYNLIQFQPLPHDQGPLVRSLRGSR